MSAPRISVDSVRLHPFRERRERAARRRNADRRILHGEAISWRERELTALRRREQLARSLRSVLDQLDGHALPGSSPLNSPAARRHVGLVRQLAAALEDGSGGVSGRGMILVDQLFADGAGPLFDRAREGELEQALRSALDAVTAR